MIARARIAPAAATAFVDAAAETFALRYARNAHVADRTSQLPATSACVGVSANAEASTELSSWPGFAPSPVVSLPDLANAAGVASVVLKCEGGRFGIGSFKALGAPYAVAKLMKDDARPRTLSTASDGNHGVALAWAAKRHGCVAKIYLHHGVSAARAAAVERLGAEVVRAGDTYSCRVDMPQTGRGDAAAATLIFRGDESRRRRGVPRGYSVETGARLRYDESMAMCREDSAKFGWDVVQDASWEGYEDVPADILSGYTLVASELVEQLDAPPTHVFVNCGVGGFAASVCG